MLDPAVVRDDPGRIRRMLEARGVEFDVDGLAAASSMRLAAVAAAEEARARKNAAGRAIARAKKEGRDAAAELAEMARVAAELAGAEADLQAADDRYGRLARAAPNMVDEGVPVGGPEANAEVRRWGGEPAGGRRGHAEVAGAMIDLGRAAKVAGSRFYYLRGGLVRLNMALAAHAVDFLAKKGYEPVQPPYMINRRSMEGAVIAEDFEDVIYKVDGEDLYMIGTSEHALAAMHAGEILDGRALPLRYAGFSPCFRKEAGTHGSEDKGIFRVHQFDKVEQFAFARPEDSRAELERMVGLAEEFYRGLGLPHRTVLLSSGDMGKASARTYDIEAWMAGQGAYREVVSCSNCLDFQARRLMVRFRDSTDARTRYVHTLNGTLVATARAMAAIIEHFADGGRIRVPGPLQGYVGSDAV